MKKTILFLAAVATMASCSKDGSMAPANRAQMEMTVNVGIGTRATYDDNLKAMWESTDKIAVAQSYPGAVVSNLSFDAYSNDNAKGTASFKGTVTYMTESAQYFNYAYIMKGDTNVATLTINDKNATIYTYTVAASQSNNAWAPALCVSSTDKLTPSNAKSTSINFGSAKNALLIVKVNEGDNAKNDVKTIVVTTAGDGLSGTMTYTASDKGAFSDIPAYDRTNSITATFTAPHHENQYWINVLPASAQTVTFTITDEDGTQKIISSKDATATFEAGKYTTATVDWTTSTIEFATTASFSDGTSTGDDIIG